MRGGVCGHVSGWWEYSSCILVSKQAPMCGCACSSALSRTVPHQNLLSLRANPWPEFSTSRVFLSRTSSQCTECAGSCLAPEYVCTCPHDECWRQHIYRVEGGAGCGALESRAHGGPHLGGQRRQTSSTGSGKAQPRVAAHSTSSFLNFAGTALARCGT